MAKYIELKEAAEQLGISADELNELREQNEVRAFRDGSTWKFKSDDLETLSTKLRDRKPEEGLGLGEEDADEGGDSILLSERELGAGVSASSTIIGKNDSGDDDDIPLASDDPSASGSDVSLEPEDDLDDLSLADSGIALADDDLDSLGKDFESGDEDSTSKVEATKSKAPAEDSGLSLAEDSGLSLGGDSDLSLAGGGTDMKLDDDNRVDDDDMDMEGGSTINLSGDDDDEELVLGGSGSDVSSGVGDSGISLMDPSDSGLDLEEASLDLGSGIGGESLELGEEDMITLGGEDADLSAATQLGGEEDFLLTPLEDAEDESGSGSQVIALDADGGFDASSATMPVGGDAMAMLEEDLGPVGGGLAASPIGAMPAPQQQVVTIAQPEAPYSIFNVLALFVCVLVLCLVGIMMFDLVRNIWTWGEPYDTNSAILDAVREMFDL